MRSFIACLLVIMFAQADPARRDLDALEGEWVIAGLEVNGVDVEPSKLEGTVLTVKGDHYTVKLKDLSFRCQITLDAGKDPREIDMLFLDGDHKDKTQKGIYRFENGTFQLVRGIHPDQNRPRDFATWPNSNIFMATWKKRSP